MTATASIENGEDREAALLKALKSCLKKGGFRGRDAVLCLSGGDVLIQHQRVNLGEGEEWPTGSGGGDAIYSKVRDQLRLNTAWDINDTVTRFVPVGGGGDSRNPRREVIVVAVKRSLIDSYLKVFGSLRLRLLRIGVEPFALRNVILRLCPKEWTGERPAGVLNIGESRVEIMVIDQGRVSFIRTLPLGIDRLTESIARRMNIDVGGMGRIIAALGEGREVNESVRKAVRSAVRPEMEFLATEILTCFRYFSATNPNTSVEKIIAFGNGAALLAGRRFIEERLRIPVRFFGTDMPKEGDGGTPPAGVLQDAFAALCGLVIGGGKDSEEVRIDFLPSEIEERRLRSKINRVRVLYLLIVLVFMGMYYLKSGERVEVLSNLNRMYQNRCSLLDVTVREVKTLDAETRTIRECGEKLKETASPVLATRLLAEAACVAGPNISFNRITSSYSFASKVILRGKRRKKVPDLSRPVLLLTIEGSALSADDVSSFVERLKKTGAFTSIRDEGSWDLRQSGMELKKFTIKLAVGDAGEG